MDLVDLGTLGNTNVSEEGLFLGQQNDDFTDLFSFTLDQTTNLEINGSSDTPTTITIGFDPNNGQPIEVQAYRVKLRIAEDLNNNNLIDDGEVIETQDDLLLPTSQVVSDPNIEPKVVFQQDLSSGDYILELTPIPLEAPFIPAFSISYEIDISPTPLDSSNNNAPIAVDDAYNINENTLLIINALEGVLSNDSDPEADSLTVTLIEDVDSGELNLDSKGASHFGKKKNKRDS